jgi:predicted 3-demethylubiquinone-9 3-methyltransferase (glyoxalase superfamily)
MEAAVQKITTFLTFNDQAGDAMTLYTSIFKRSRIVSTTPGPDGKVMTGEFELEGQPFIALNGGPTFTFAEGISLFVTCETQREIDDYSAKLIAGGGSQGPCGWVKDRFGVSWQIVPRILAELLRDPDRARADRALKAMLGMKKLDIEGLQRAAEGR